MQQKDYVRKRGDRPELLLLGDSRMKAAVIPEQLADNAYNLSLGGATASEMYYSLRTYLKKHPKPERIIMGFGCFHYDCEDCFKTRTLYFHFLPLEEELEIQFAGCRLGLFGFDGLKEEVADTLRYELLFPQKYSAACINGKFKKETYNRGQYQKNAAGRGHMFFGTGESDAGLAEEAYRSCFVEHPRVDHYLRRIIGLCKERGIPLYIEQLPMNEPSWEALCGSGSRPDGFYNGYKSYLLSLAEGTGIPVETKIPCYAPEFFGDHSHLNPRGAERFTAEIKAKYGL